MDEGLKLKLINLFGSQELHKCKIEIIEEMMVDSLILSVFGTVRKISIRFECVEGQVLCFVNFINPAYCKISDQEEQKLKNYIWRKFELSSLRKMLCAIEDSEFVVIEADIFDTGVRTVIHPKVKINGEDPDFYDNSDNEDMCDEEE
jgi:hypothetical protein